MVKLRQTGLVWLWLSALLFGLDVYSKYLANSYLNYADPLAVTSFFNLYLSYNQGAAFSFLADAGGMQRWFFIIISLLIIPCLIYWLAQLSKQQRILSIAYALILAGALGNTYDRILYGYVIDFISLHYGQFYFAIFNIADIAISIGAFLLVLYILFLDDSSKS